MAEILLVDDDPDIANLLSLMLTSEGHNVSLFTSPERAIEQYKASDYDIVLSDQMMPMLGTEMVQRLHEKNKNCGISLGFECPSGPSPCPPMLIMTAYPEAFRAKVYPCKFIRAVLVKPLNIDTVLSAIEHAMRRRRTGTWPPPV